VVISKDPHLKAGLESAIQHLLGSNEVIGILWEHPSWNDKEIAGHKIIKSRSRIVVEPDAKIH
jgi:hypothetical protein